MAVAPLVIYKLAQTVASFPANAVGLSPTIMLVLALSLAGYWSAMEFGLVDHASTN